MPLSARRVLFGTPVLRRKAPPHPLPSSKPHDRGVTPAAAASPRAYAAVLALVPRAAIAATVVIAPLGILGSVSACGAAAPVLAEPQDAGDDADAWRGPLVDPVPTIGSTSASTAASAAPPSTDDPIAPGDDNDAGP